MALNPRRKRLIQSSISGYFPSLPRSQSDPSTSPTNAAHSTFLVLPDQIQSSLINVGMRVRKAVPEGYKTTKPNKMEFIDSSLSDRGRNMQDRAPKTAMQGRTLVRAASELMPFCGVHRIGGYGIQEDTWDQRSGLELEMTAAECFGNTYTSDMLPATCFTVSEEDGDATFFSSQSSTTSTLSRDSAPLAPPVMLPLHGKKRGIVADDDDEEVELNSDRAVGEEMVSNIQGLDTNIVIPNRVIATARRKTRGENGGRIIPASLRSANSLLAGEDFEEVAFLRICSDDEESGMDLDAT